MLWRHKKKANIEAKDQPKDKDIKQWITVNGVHIPIKKGQNKDDVVDDFISKQKDDEPKKDKPKTDTKDVYDKSTYDNDNGRIYVKIPKVKPEQEKNMSIVRNVWNDIPNTEKTGVNELRIIPEPTTKKDSKNLGTYSKYGKSIEITLSNLSTQGDDNSITKKTKAVILHEIAHSKFDNYDDEVKQKWSNEVLNYNPISGYLKKYKTNVIKSKNKLNSIIDDIEQQKKDWATDINKFQKQIDSGKLSTDKDIFGTSELDTAKTWIDKGNKAIKALDEEKAQYQKEHDIVVQTFGSETHSEFTVLKNGVETVWKQDNSVYNELKPIYDKLFGGKK